MSTAKFIEVHVGDVVRLRKPHACGGTDWTVVRLGADIGLRCERCKHRILLARSVFERRLKTFLSRAVVGTGPASGDGLGELVDSGLPPEDG
jgi:hypothetical protein